MNIKREPRRLHPATVKRIRESERDHPVQPGRESAGGEYAWQRKEQGPKTSRSSCYACGQRMEAGKPALHVLDTTPRNGRDGVWTATERWMHQHDCTGALEG